MEGNFKLYRKHIKLVDNMFFLSTEITGEQKTLVNNRSKHLSIYLKSTTETVEQAVTYVQS